MAKRKPVKRYKAGSQVSEAAAKSAIDAKNEAASKAASDQSSGGSRSNPTKQGSTISRADADRVIEAKNKAASDQSGGGTRAAVSSTSPGGRAVSRAPQTSPSAAPPSVAGGGPAEQAAVKAMMDRGGQGIAGIPTPTQGGGQLARDALLGKRGFGQTPMYDAAGNIVGQYGGEAVGPMGVGMTPTTYIEDPGYFAMPGALPPQRSATPPRTAMMDIRGRPLGARDFMAMPDPFMSPDVAGMGPESALIASRFRPTMAPPTAGAPPAFDASQPAAPQSDPFMEGYFGAMPGMPPPGMGSAPQMGAPMQPPPGMAPPTQMGPGAAGAAPTQTDFSSAPTPSPMTAAPGRDPFIDMIPSELLPPAAALMPGGPTPQPTTDFSAPPAGVAPQQIAADTAQTAGFRTPAANVARIPGIGPTVAGAVDRVGSLFGGDGGGPFGLPANEGYRNDDGSFDFEEWSANNGGDEGGPRDSGNAPMPGKGGGGYTPGQQQPDNAPYVPPIGPPGYPTAPTTITPTPAYQSFGDLNAAAAQGFAGNPGPYTVSGPTVFPDVPVPAPYVPPPPVTGPGQPTPPSTPSTGNSFLDRLLGLFGGSFGMAQGGMVQPGMTNAFTPGSYYASYDPRRRGLGGM